MTNKTILCFLLIYMSNVAFSQLIPTSQNTAIHEGVLMIKFKEGSLAESLRATSARQSIVPSSLRGKGVLSLKSVLRNPKQVQSQWQGLSPQKSTKAAAIGLDRLYKVVLNKGVDPVALAQELSKLPQVAYAEPVYKNELLYIPNDTYVTSMWHHTSDFARVFDAWDISKGDKDIVIGIIDTGALTYLTELREAWHYNDAERYGIDGIDDDFNGYVDDSLGYNFADQEPVVSDIFANRHGTRVAMTASGTPDNGFGIAGTGFNCRMMPMQVFGNSQQIITEFEAILYGAENGCDIINLSLGRTGLPAKYEQDVIDYATEVHDVLLLAASGNSGREELYYPASYKNIMSIGAQSTGSHDVAWWSTHSHWVDLVAPGESIAISWPYGDNDIVIGYSGTSAATPFVAGIAGLVRSKYPELSAKQVAAVLRQTSNTSIYANPIASGRFEKNGKGGVDAYAALTETMKYPAIVAKEVHIANQSPFRSEEMWPGDTISLSVDFVNYLAPTQNANITLSSTSPYITVLQSDYNLGTLNTLEERTNTSQAFQFIIHNDDIPVGTKALFRLEYEDEAMEYADFQYIELDIVPNDLYTTFAYLGASMGSNGRLGHIGGQPGDLGDGIQYRGKQLIKESGLIIATSESQVSDAVRIDANIKSSDFSGGRTPYFDYINYIISEAAMYTTFNDYGGINPNPIGLDIEHRIIGWWGAREHYNYLAFEYSIKNNSGQDIESLYAGLFTDWALEGNKPLYANWDEEGRFAYVHSQEGEYMAIRPIHQDYTYYPIDMLQSDGVIDMADDFSDAEKYQSLAIQPPNNQLGGTLGTDIANVVGRSIGYLSAGATAKASFILMYGTSLEELRTTANASVENVDARYQSEEVQLSNEVFCPQDDFILMPDKEGYYRFYADEALTDLLHAGRFYELPRNRIGKSLYIVNCTNLLPSTALEVIPRLGVGRPGVPPKGVVAMSSYCKDQRKWQHYRTSAGSATYFSVYSEEDLALDITITSLATPGESAYYSSEDVGGGMNASYFMGKYWNIHRKDNKALGPETAIRVYYDKKDAQALERRAIDWASKASGIKSEMQWFLTDDPIFDPNKHTDESGVNIPYTLLEPTNSGVERGVSYVEFSGLQQLSGTIGSMINVNGALPAELTGFEVNRNDEGYIDIAWKTAQEVNNKHFEVEKSLEGKGFERIATIQGQGNSDMAHTYQMKDQEAFTNGTIYYRLKQVDFDGKFTYSEVRSVQGFEPLAAVQVMPNPSQGLVYIQWTAVKTEGEIVIYNSMGQLVKTASVAPVSKQEISLKQLPKGVYFLHLPPQTQGQQVWPVTLQP